MGANGDAALHNIAPHLAGALPDAAFAAPDAPKLLNETKPGSRRWFNMDQFKPTLLGPAVREAAAALDQFIDAELEKYQLPATEYALIGFSQGAMTVLFAGLRRNVAPRAIVAFSGALLDPASLPNDIKNRPQVLLTHGEVDQILAPQHTRDAATALQAVGVPVETMYSPVLNHGIDEACYDAARKFLSRAFDL
jgi:phospholipase/carboxylesterase